MTKKIKRILLTISFSAFTIIFIFNLVGVISYVTNPMDFELMNLIYTLLFFVVMLVHVGVYIATLNEKDKVVKQIDDVEEWWKKWDMI